MKNSVSGILEGLHRSGTVNEAKIQNYRFINGNIPAGGLDDYKDFIKKVEMFAKSFLPKMDEKMKMVCDITEFVGSGPVATITFYGWRDMYKDDGEFSLTNNRNNMEKHIGSLFKSVIGDYDSISASTYWDAKYTFGRKKELIGPYVDVTVNLRDI